MSMYESNKIVVDGNDNITLQNSDGNTINLTQLDDKAVGKALHNFFAQEVHFLLIPPPDCADAETWLPFGQGENMLAYLHQYCEKRYENVKPRATVVQDSTLLARKEVEAYFRYMRLHTILIADMQALPAENNKGWLQLFDDYHIGGCVVVGKEASANEAFTFLNIYNNQLSGTLETSHIWIENIFKENHLDKILGAIINKVLNKHTIHTSHKPIIPSLLP